MLDCDKHHGENIKVGDIRSLEVIGIGVSGKAYTAGP